MSEAIDARNPSLADRLRERITRVGPISFRDWMQAALYDEREGYYCRPGRIRQGRAGDYRTAPETSSLFAATFARYFAKLFAELGSPSRWNIVEAGAGSGEFALGVLATLHDRHPDVCHATDYVIDEISSAIRAQAAARLSEFEDHLTFQRISKISKPLAGIIFSNELIDAFPVHRVTMRNGLLRELCVGVDETNFVWVECDPDSQVKEYCRRAELSLHEGQIAEINLHADAYISRAASLVQRGFVITVDYGAERNELLNSPNRFKGTLRTFHRHYVGDNALSHPGEQDLTTTIDWTQMIEAGERNGFESLRLQRLDQFLLMEGAIEEMQEASATISNQGELFNFNAGARELIMPDGLAASFQVLVQRKGS